MRRFFVSLFFVTCLYAKELPLDIYAEFVKAKNETITAKKNVFIPDNPKIPIKM